MRERPKADAEAVAAQHAFVRRLVEAGAGRAQVRAACERLPSEGGLGVGRARADAVYDAVRATMRSEFDRERPLLKAEQAARLRSFISRAAQDRVEVVGHDRKGKPVERRKGPNWSAVASLEEKYAKVAGTNDPDRVEVNVDDERVKAIAVVLGVMDPARRAQLEADQARVEADAAAYRQLTAAVAPGPARAANAVGANGVPANGAKVQ